MFLWTLEQERMVGTRAEAASGDALMPELDMYHLLLGSWTA